MRKKIEGGEKVDTYNGFNHGPEKYNFEQAKQQQFGYTKAQWKLSVLVIAMMAGSICMAGVFSVVVHVWIIAVVMAEFGALLFVSLLGGLIPKADYPIHVLAEEMAQRGDWHEHLRTLHRKKWLNYLPDIIGLVPASLALFIGNNCLIYKVWDLSWSPFWLIGLNVILLLLSGAMIPLVCEKAHQEVKEQVRIYNENQKKPLALSGSEPIHSRSVTQ